MPQAYGYAAPPQGQQGPQPQQPKAPAANGAFGPGMAMADPFSAAAQRAQARVDAGRTAAQTALASRLQGFGQTRTRTLDDAEFALRTGAEANMRHLTGVNAINSGLRDRFAERLQGAVGRPLTRSLENIGAAEDQARGQTAQQIATLEGNLPVMQAEELGRQYNLDASGLANAINKAGMTGKFLPPQAEALIQGVLDAKSQWQKLAAAGDTAGAQQVSETATQLRTALQKMGFDPSGIGGDVAGEQAAKNAGGMGTMTPAARQMAANMSWYDPVTGKATLSGRQALSGLSGYDPETGKATLAGRQALSGLSGYDPETGKATLAGQSAFQGLAMGQINLDVAGNPEYGAGAQARARINVQNAQANAANRSGADPLAGLSKSRGEVSQKWGLSDTGLTTNWAALDNLLTEIAGKSLAGETSANDVEAYLTANASAMRGMGVDPRAVRAAVQAFLRDASPAANRTPEDQSAWSSYLAGERDAANGGNGGGTLPQFGAPGGVVPPDNWFDWSGMGANPGYDLSNPGLAIPAYGPKPAIPQPPTGGPSGGGADSTSSGLDWYLGADGVYHPRWR